MIPFTLKPNEAAAELTFRFLSPILSFPPSLFSNLFCCLVRLPRKPSFEHDATHVYVSSARIETQSHFKPRPRACGNLFYFD